MAIVAGEITTKAAIDIQKTVRDVIRDVGYIDDHMGICADTCSVLSGRNTSGVTPRYNFR